MAPKLKENETAKHGRVGFAQNSGGERYEQYLVLSHHVGHIEPMGLADDISDSSTAEETIELIHHGVDCRRPIYPQACAKTA